VNRLDKRPFDRCVLTADFLLSVFSGSGTGQSGISVLSLTPYRYRSLQLDRFENPAGDVDKCNGSWILMAWWSASSPNTVTGAENSTAIVHAASQDALEDLIAKLGK
jgi:hypothetical protein